MKKMSATVAIGLVALALAGCGSTAHTQTVAATVSATATGPALGQPQVGDGGRIAVALKQGDDAWIVSINPDGTDPQELNHGQTFNACPDIGPGGSMIAFCTNRTGAFEIWLMDGTGDNQRQLTRLGGDSTFPDISPDGRRIVFCGSATSSSDHDIWVVGVDGTGLRQLTRTPGQDDCNPVWSPDGSKVLFTSDRSGTPELWVMDATGNGVRQLTTGQSAGNEPPDWSPDGRRIAYIQADGVWIMDADGHNPRRLTQAPGTDYAPAWSPQGNEIVYRHLAEDGTGSLRIVSVQSGQSRVLPIHELGMPLAPSWGSAAA
jgi:Tol biopolymer transport system component